MAIDWKSDFITYGIFVVILIIVYRILILVINRYDKKTPGTHTHTNALKVILRFFVIFIVIISLITLIDTDSPLIAALASVSGIIIGFGSTEVVSQITAGIYLITARPFNIHDMIKIGNIEGVVVEINLNYTIIKQFDGTFLKIPNKKMMDSQFRNFTLKLDEDTELYKELRKNDESFSWKEIKNLKIDRENLQKMVYSLAKTLNHSNITCYTFVIEIELDKNPKVIKEQLAKVCEEFAPLYDYKPQFSVMNFGFRATFKFWIFCANPHLIMEKQNDFMGAIANAIYLDEEDHE